MQNRKVTALLPMKGHSERVPNKNIRLFNGKPLFFHVLSSLQESNYIDQIIINTDSSKIADLAKEFSKVIIHKRPAEICGDFVSMNDIIDFDIEKSKKDYFIQTHSTNPLLTTASIDNGIISFFNHLEKFDSVFSVTKLQTRLYTKGAKPLNHNPKELLRTQDLEPLYEENSNFFIFSKKSFLEAGKKRIGVTPNMLELDKLEAIDIDEPQDFILAEAIQKLNLIK